MLESARVPLGYLLARTFRSARASARGSENDVVGDYREKAEVECQRRDAAEHGAVQSRPKFYVQGAASASSTLGKIRKKFSRRALSRIGRTSSRTPARIKSPP